MDSGGVGSSHRPLLLAKASFILTFALGLLSLRRRNYYMLKCETVEIILVPFNTFKTHIHSCKFVFFEVFEASVLLLFQEKNCRKGRFCPSKLKGKRVIELGAGCGVAGFGEL